MNVIKQILRLVVVCMLLSTISACVKIELFDPLPSKAQIILTTDWTNRDLNIPIPEKYVVVIDNQAQTFEKASNMLPTLDAGKYSLRTYNTPPTITIKENIASLEVVNGTVIDMSDYLFTSAMNITIQDGKNENHIAIMKQQIRDLNLELTINEGNPNRIKDVEAKFGGVASELDIDTEVLSGSAVVVPSFTRQGDKLSAKLRLLGVIGKAQIMTLTITFDDNTTQTIDSDLSALLVDFNSKKHEPLFLKGILINTPTEVGGITASIIDWAVQSGNVVVN